VACASAQLEARPVARTVLGTPLVLFRGAEGKASALLDRCAHRNVALSRGRVVDHRLECAYHGWQYGADGRCARIPGLCVESDREGRVVPKFSAVEQDGFVWVFMTPDVEPEGRPFLLPPMDAGAVEVRRTVDVEAPLHATLENALDVPHTAILHQGLFRGSRERVRIKARVRRTAEGLEAEYLGEPRPSGWAAKILSPSGGVVTHFDRFILPSIAQVEYRLGTEARFVVTSICTPVEEFRTRLQAVIAYRTRLPGFLVKLMLDPVATRIFDQDAAILKAQGEALRRWGGEHYASTSIDVLGLQIARLLRQASGSAESGPDDWSREIDLEV
jgi:phenylpropionate dioxygenase-like ring-hydroxylating dioxygenase large terminal subunit